jgi:hypothetical protein
MLSRGHLFLPPRYGHGSTVRGGSRSWQILKIVHILGAAARLLIDFEVVKVNHIDAYPVQIGFDPSCVTIIKFHTGDACQYLDPDGWYTHPDNSAFLEKYINGNVRRVKASAVLAALDGDTAIQTSMSLVVRG